MWVTWSRGRCRVCPENLSRFDLEAEYRPGSLLCQLFEDVFSIPYGGRIIRDEYVVLWDEERLILSTASMACNAPTGKTMLPDGAPVSRGFTRMSFPPRELTFSPHGGPLLASSERRREKFRYSRVQSESRRPRPPTANITDMAAAVGDLQRHTVGDIALVRDQVGRHQRIVAGVEDDLFQPRAGDPFALLLTGLILRIKGAIEQGVGVHPGHQAIYFFWR